jgi:glycerate kinase
VADVQVAVGLGRETGVDGGTGITAAVGNIFFNKGVDEIFAFSNLSHIGNLSFG